MTQHTLKQFDVELEEIRRGVLQMGGLVETQVARALEGLASGDLALLDAVTAGDKEVNLAQIKLDDECSRLIARRQPAATDLRFVLSAIKAVADLERIGDEAKKIAKAARRLLQNEPAGRPRVQMKHLGAQAVAQLRKSLDAMARLDIDAAAEVVKEDRELDDEFKSVMRQLITFMMEDPRTLSRGIETLFAAKALERIGDHAKNIAEYTIYLVRGRDVRHIGVSEVLKEVGYPES